MVVCPVLVLDPVLLMDEGTPQQGLQRLVRLFGGVGTGHWENKCIDKILKMVKQVPQRANYVGRTNIYGHVRTDGK